MYLTKQFHRIMKPRASKSPRARFVRYYNDLHVMEKKTAPPKNSFKVANQYTYTDLADAILAISGARVSLSNLELFIFTYWSHEFDPEFHYGGYFSDKFSINALMIDVCDQGILAPIMAMMIIQSYLSSRQFNQAGLLCVDQTAIPVAPDFLGAKPGMNSARLLIFQSSQVSERHYKVNNLSINRQTICAKKAMTNPSDIYVTPECQYYSCPEIFTPLLEGLQNCKSSVKKNLSVIDIVSHKYGNVSLECMS